MFFVGCWLYLLFGVVLHVAVLWLLYLLYYRLFWVMLLLVDSGLLVIVLVISLLGIL